MPSKKKAHTTSNSDPLPLSTSSPRTINLTSFATVPNASLSIINNEVQSLPEPALLDTALARLRAQDKPDICSSYFMYFCPNFPEGAKLERLRLLNQFMFDWNTMNNAFVEAMTQRRIESGVLPADRAGMCARAEYRATLWNVMTQNSLVFSHVDHQARTHMLETEIAGLHAQILVKILDEFAVAIEGFPNMMHIMHKIVEDMVAAIKEGVFEELQYFIMLTMYETKDDISAFSTVFSFSTTSDLREWVQKPAREKRLMEKVKVKLEMAQHSYWFAPEEYCKIIEHQDEEAFTKMTELRPKRWIVAVPPEGR